MVKSKTEGLSKSDCNKAKIPRASLYEQQQFAFLQQANFWTAPRWYVQWEFMKCECVVYLHLQILPAITIN